MKILLALICSPAYIVGFICGFFFVPFKAGLIQGASILLAKEQRRLDRILQEETENRELDYDTLMSIVNTDNPEEGAVLIDGPNEGRPK